MSEPYKPTPEELAQITPQLAELVLLMQQAIHEKVDVADKVREIARTSGIRVCLGIEFEFGFFKKISSEPESFVDKEGKIKTGTFIMNDFKFLRANHISVKDFHRPPK